MHAQIFDDALKPVWVLSKNVLNYDYNLLNDVLSRDFGPNQLVESQYAPFRRIL